ncbi:MAG: tetratricopeptide repeat protein [Bdellovibrionaceae bacterium]|nr:tetratricopeptide repeat protein [Pseudobdellovibrionaceae bacterium]
MPRLILRLSALVAAALSGAGCATNSLVSGGDIFRESSADVANRAPNSLSVPQEAANGDQIDPLQMRVQADYHFALAESYSLEANTVRAIEEYKLTLVYDPQSAMVRFRLAQEYVKQGLVSEAMEQAKLALEHDPKLVEAHMLLGGLHSALKMYTEAMAMYRTVLELDPENTDAPMFIGALYAEQKRYPEAITQFETLAKNKENRSPHVAWYYVGRIQLEEGKPGAEARAEKAFLKALEQKPEFVDATLALGQIYESRNKRDQAKQLYKSFQAKSGPDAGVAEALGRLHLEDEEFDKAFEQYEVLESNDDENLNVKVKMAFILIEKKKYSEAILKLEEILSRAPYSDKIRFYLGAVYEEIKEYKAAIAQFAKIPIGSSYYAEGVVHTAYLHKLNGDYRDAVKAIEEGIRNQPEHPQFYALYASFLDDLKEYEKGIAMLQAAVSKFPEHAQLHFFLGSMHDRLGQTAKTEKSMTRVLEIDANHVQALNFLAYTYAEQNKELDSAERLVRRALELQPNDGYIMDTLGWVLFKKGDTAEAVKVLEAAYKEQPSESVIAEHLGDAYYKLQLPEKAKRMYQRAFETETNDANQRKIRNKIVSIDQQQQSVGVPAVGAPASARKPASDSGR